MAKEKEISSEQAKKIGEVLGVDWSKFNIQQFKKGMTVEMEHGKRYTVTNVTDDDPLFTGKIALVHLNEFSDYYIRLEKMEDEAGKYWASR